MTVPEGLDRITENVAIRSLIVIDSVAAGLVHAAVVPEHLEEGLLVGAFFVLVATVQVLAAIPVALRASGATYPALALVNGVVIAIWVVSRTVGVPVGPGPWTPEPVGTLDVAATAFETLVVAGALALTDRPRSRATVLDVA